MGWIWGPSGEYSRLGISDNMKMKRMKTMKSKKASSKTTKKKVPFSFYGPDAKEIFLVGDFNQWNKAAHPMKMDSEGIWRKFIFLPPGAYEYKFLVDGVWVNDQKNEAVCENSFGTHNNLFVVEEN
jgi:1,4-alpha-glucan branching enzyme